MAPNPLVSVIIPTFERPALVLQAVNSALKQTINDLEIIVVIDGGDSATRAALESLSLPQLRVLPLKEQVGGSRARNEGVVIAMMTICGCRKNWNGSSQPRERRPAPTRSWPAKWWLRLRVAKLFGQESPPPNLSRNISLHETLGPRVKVYCRPRRSS